MPGTLHIFRLDAASGTSPTQYQANYNTPGNSYAGAFTQEKMERMLRFGLGMADAEVAHIILEVQRAGRFTLSDVDIPLPEAAMFGLEQTPSDF
jgi:hypothetical protein